MDDARRHRSERRGLATVGIVLGLLAPGGWLGCSAAAPGDSPGPAAAPTVAVAPTAALPDGRWRSPQPPTSAGAEPRKAAAAASLEALDGALWLAQGDSTSGRWHLGYRFEGAHYHTSGHPTWDESGQVALVEAEGQRLRLRFSERVYDGKPDEPAERWLELSDDGGAFTMGGLRFVKQPAAAIVAAPTGRGEAPGAGGGPDAAAPTGSAAAPGAGGRPDAAAATPWRRRRRARCVDDRQTYICAP